MKKLKVTVDGKAYEVIVEEIDGGAPAAAGAPAPAPVSSSSSSVAPPAAAAPKPAAPPAAGGPGQVVSPLSGRVVAINCGVGDAVDSGANIVTLEAMKMNTFVTAPSAGTVKEVLVKEGDAVEEGQVLAVIG